MSSDSSYSTTNSNSNTLTSFHTPLLSIENSQEQEENSDDSTSISDTSINLDHIIDTYLRCLASRMPMIHGIPGVGNLNHDLEDDGESPLSRIRTLDVEDVEQEAEEEKSHLIVNNKDVANYLPCFDDFFDVPHHHNIIQITHLDNLYYFQCMTTPEVGNHDDTSIYHQPGVRVEKKIAIPSGMLIAQRMKKR